jgi:hypothetical protein
MVSLPDNIVDLLCPMVDLPETKVDLAETKAKGWSLYQV